MRHQTFRVLAAVSAVGALVVACGGDEPTDTENTSGAPATPAATTDTTADPQATVEESTPAPSASAGVGFIEISGTRYDVTVSDCLDMAGAMGGRFKGVDDPDNVSGDFSFSPDDWETRNSSEGWTEPGSLTLRVEEPYLQWESGVSLIEVYNLPAGVTAEDVVVTRFEIDEQTLSVQGEATFLEVNSLMTGSATPPSAGTFAFACPAG